MEFFPNCFYFAAKTREQASVDNNFNHINFDLAFETAELNAIWDAGYYNFSRRIK